MRKIFGMSLLASLGLFWGLSGGMSQAAQNGMAPVLSGYLNVQSTLADDSLEGAKKAASAMVKGLKSAGKELDGKSVASIRAAAQKMEKSANLADARQAFRELTDPMVQWAEKAKPTGVDILFCSMANAKWLQKSGAVRNPYYGAQMRECGEVVTPAAQPKS